MLSMGCRLRIAVIDKYPLFRDGVVQAIVRHKDLTVVGQGATAPDAARIVREVVPDILLMEPAIASSLAVAREIVQANSNLKVIFLASVEDEDEAIQALHAGVHGYIVKGITGSSLVDAVRAVHRGERYITPDLACRLVMRPMALSRSAREPERPHLSVREQQVLDGMLGGLSNFEMARMLGLGLSTIKHYKTILYRKMRVRNRVEALAIEANPLGACHAYRETCPVSSSAGKMHSG
jgi:DNA-binding NarL/FixJ family response regulator